MITSDSTEHLGKSIADYELNIGKRVCKATQRKYGNGKPFRSGNKVNTIKGVIMHPIMHIPSYTFVEDDSYVECRRCVIVVDNEKTNITIGMDLTLLQNVAGADVYNKDLVMRMYSEGDAKIITREGRKYLAKAIDQTQLIAEIKDITELKPTE